MVKKSTPANSSEFKTGDSEAESDGRKERRVM
jgi:hypothetical protein